MNTFPCTANFLNDQKQRVLLNSSVSTWEEVSKSKDSVTDIFSKSQGQVTGKNQKFTGAWDLSLTFTKNTRSGRQTERCQGLAAAPALLLWQRLTTSAPAPGG